jgi:hypothetical protein
VGNWNVGNWYIRYTDGPNDGIVGSNSAVGLVYPMARPLPFDWTQGADLKRYWTDEVHYTGFDGFPYYMGRGGGKSRAYDCIVSRDTPPSWCKRATSDVLAAQEQFQPESTATLDGIVENGASATHYLTVDSNKRTQFTLAWASESLSFTLIQPDGTTITPEYAAENSAFVSYEFVQGGAEFPSMATYTFLSTMPGEWALNINADPSNAASVAYVTFASMETDVTLNVSQDQENYHIGDLALFNASFEQFDSLTNVSVSALIKRPDGQEDLIEMTDNGGGTYRGLYYVPNAAGRVVIQVTATGMNDGMPFTRQVERIWNIIPSGATINHVVADYGYDEDGDGVYDTLDVLVDVTVDTAAMYHLSALLSANGTFIDSAMTPVYLSPGTSQVYLSFPATAIAQSQLDGPYTVGNAFLTRDDYSGIVVASASEVGMTSYYRASDFDPSLDSAVELWMPAIRVP